MKNVNYEKPHMVFVNLKNTQKIADSTQCMAQTSQGKTDYYYDVPGNGYLLITMMGENCSGNHYTPVWIPKNEGDPKPSDDVINKAIAEVEDILKPNQKQQFSSVLPTPDPSWS